MLMIGKIILSLINIILILLYIIYEHKYSIDVLMFGNHNNPLVVYICSQTYQSSLKIFSSQEVAAHQFHVALPWLNRMIHYGTTQTSAMTRTRKKLTLFGQTRAQCLLWTVQTRPCLTETPTRVSGKITTYVYHVTAYWDLIGQFLDQSKGWNVQGSECILGVLICTIFVLFVQIRSLIKIIRVSTIYQLSRDGRMNEWKVK
jgi:hypothetical protein